MATKQYLVVHKNVFLSVAPNLFSFISSLAARTLFCSVMVASTRSRGYKPDRTAVRKLVAARAKAGKRARAAAAPRPSWREIIVQAWNSDRNNDEWK